MQISKEAWNLKAQLDNLRKVQNLCTCGLMISLYVILSLCNVPVSDTLEIRFGFLVFIASGMIGGPVMGFTVGFLGDMLNCLVRGFAYFPGFSFNYALLGFCAGLILYRSRFNRLRAAACAFVEYLISISLSTVWLCLMYGTPFGALFTTRLIKCTLTFFINLVLIYVFLEAFQRILHSVRPLHG